MKRKELAKITETTPTMMRRTNRKKNLPSKEDILQPPLQMKTIIKTTEGGDAFDGQKTEINEQKPVQNR